MCAYGENAEFCDTRQIDTIVVVILHNSTWFLQNGSNWVPGSTYVCSFLCMKNIWGLKFELNISKSGQCGHSRRKHTRNYNVQFFFSHQPFCFSWLFQLKNILVVLDLYVVGSKNLGGTGASHWRLCRSGTNRTQPIRKQLFFSETAKMFQSVAYKKNNNAIAYQFNC